MLREPRVNRQQCLVVFALLCGLCCSGLIAGDAGEKTSSSQLVCPKCGRAGQSGWKFCPYDATPLKVAAVAAPNPAGGKLIPLDLSEAGEAYGKLDDDKFRAKYSRKKDGWYVLKGTLDLVSFRGYKLYGLKQSKTAVVLSSANALDYWFPALRANVGKEVTVGTRGLSRGMVGSSRDASTLAGRGYPVKGRHVMNASGMVVYGIPPAEKVKGDSKMQAHRDELAAEHTEFTHAVDSAGTGGEVAGGKLVDPSKLPTGTLDLVITTPLTGALSLTKHTLYVTIEGPVVKKFSKANVAYAIPTRVEFRGIPQGKYKVTAEFGSHKGTDEVNVKGLTQKLDFAWN